MCSLKSPLTSLLLLQPNVSAYHLAKLQWNKLQKKTKGLCCSALKEPGALPHGGWGVTARRAGCGQPQPGQARWGRCAHLWPVLKSDLNWRQWQELGWRANGGLLLSLTCTGAVGLHRRRHGRQARQCPSGADARLTNDKACSSCSHVMTSSSQT